MSDLLVISPRASGVYASLNPRQVRNLKLTHIQRVALVGSRERLVGVVLRYARPRELADMAPAGARLAYPTLVRPQVP